MTPLPSLPQCLHQDFIQRCYFSTPSDAPQMIAKASDALSTALAHQLATNTLIHYDLVTGIQTVKLAPRIVHVAFFSGYLGVIPHPSGYVLRMTVYFEK